MALTLIIWSSFGAVDTVHAALLAEGPNHSKSGSKASSCKAAGVAVSE